MILSWLTYALLVGVLVSLAAVVAEGAVRSQGWSGRWVWAGAMALTAGLPLATWLIPAAPAPAPIPAWPGALVMESLPVVVSTSEPAASLSPEEAVLLAWGSVSAVLLLVVVALLLRLRARLRLWPLRRVDGVDVLVSQRTGPAAVGVLRARVVVPEWALELEGDRRRLLVLHEAEHVRARDPQLALAGLVACVLAPWHLALWWQLKRLRLAIEVDCDARVLRRTGDPGGYGRLLVEIGQKRTRLAVALAEPRTMLERRIRMMTRANKRRTAQGLGLGAVAVVLLAVACETPGPTELAAPESEEVQLAEVQKSQSLGPCEMLYYVNGERSSRVAVNELGPDGIERIMVFKGRSVLEAEGVTLEPVGEPEDAAGSASTECGIISIVTKDATPQEIERAEVLTRRLRDAQKQPRKQLTYEQVATRPTFTPMTVRPRLLNADEVTEALKESYPPLLKEAGIAGTATIWFLIDEQGTVRRTMINDSADYPALNEAALRVADLMRFSPARNRAEVVPVWIALPITFGAEAAAERTEEAFSRVRDRVTTLAERLEEGTGLPPKMDPRAREEASEQMMSLPPAEPRGDISAEPSFTPMTVRPELKNRRDVFAALMNNYPPMLRDAGIGGTVEVWFYLDEAGRVRGAKVATSSGHEQLDDAALRVAHQMEFTPAMNGDERVPVWIRLPVSFEVQ